MSATSFSPVVRPSARTETPFIFITERLTPAWPWLLVASALFLGTWIRIAVQQAQGKFNGNAKLVLAQLAPSGALDAPTVSSLYLGRIPRGGFRPFRQDTANPRHAPRPLCQLLAPVLLVYKNRFDVSRTIIDFSGSNESPELRLTIVSSRCGASRCGKRLAEITKSV